MSTESKILEIEKIDKVLSNNNNDTDTIKWYSPMERPFRLSGFHWISSDKVYRRLPLEHYSKIPENVDIRANWTAGGQISFQTNSSKMAIKVELSGKANMWHMPSTGQCGFDCYLGPPNRLSYYGITMYDPCESSYECILFDHMEQKSNHVTLNFPLYQGVRAVWIGLEQYAEICKPLPYILDKPVIFYGTSITQGGCASRPGMAYTNILSRRLNMECINLGFSGSGKGEPELARIIAEIENPACIVLDYEGNANTGGILEKTLGEFIRILRTVHSHVPILVMSKIRYAKEKFNRDEFDKLLNLKEFQRNTVENLKNNGDMNIHFCDGMELLGDDFDECTVDGMHLTDLGFCRMADRLEPILRSLIFKECYTG